jgi:glycosyltransferase involved in cell wall biosynthesis
MAQALASLPESLRKRSRLLAMGAEATLLGERAGMKLQNLGTISGDDLKALALSAADILAFASRADNLPLMLQEALACGLPAVAFRVGGVPDLVRHLETGFLAESENVEEFRARLIELAESPETRRRLSENARRVAVEEYSLERCASAYKALFAEALEANAAAKASKS